MKIKFHQLGDPACSRSKLGYESRGSTKSAPTSKNKTELAKMENDEVIDALVAFVEKLGRGSMQNLVLRSRSRDRSASEVAGPGCCAEKASAAENQIVNPIESTVKPLQATKVGSFDRDGGSLNEMGQGSAPLMSTEKTMKTKCSLPSFLLLSTIPRPILRYMIQLLLSRKYLLSPT